MCIVNEGGERRGAVLPSYHEQRKQHLLVLMRLVREEELFCQVSMNRVQRKQHLLTIFHHIFVSFLLCILCHKKKKKILVN